MSCTSPRENCTQRRARQEREAGAGRVVEGAVQRSAPLGRAGRDWGLRNRQRPSLELQFHRKPVDVLSRVGAWSGAGLKRIASGLAFGSVLEHLAY